MKYEESEAIKYIRQCVGPTLDAYDDDQLLNIIDIVWDWQEANGYLDVDDDDDDDDIDLDELTRYAIRLLHKDKGNTVDDAHVRPIIESELEFEDMADEI